MKAEVEQVLIVRKIRAATIYEVLLLGLVIALVPLGFVFGIAGFFGGDTVKWNDHPIHGIAAFCAGPAFALFVAVFFTGFVGSLTCLGLWVLSRFRPISIRVVPEDVLQGATNGTDRR